MSNLSKIKKFSKTMYVLLSLLAVVIPLYYLFYWALVNQLPETLINVNVQPVPLVSPSVPVVLQVAGFMASLLPLSALIYLILSIRRLFGFYKEGLIFSFEHVRLFKKTARALLLWVVLSMAYEAVKSVIFTAGNPPGERVLAIGFTSAEITTLLVGAIVFIIAWVMDEGRILNEENQLTV